MYYVYILQSQKDHSYYIGFSASPEDRLRQHNKGKNRYTKGHVPYRLVWNRGFETRKDAKDYEKYVKSLNNTKRFLEMIGSPAESGTGPDEVGGIP